MKITLRNLVWAAAMALIFLPTALAQGNQGQGQGQGQQQPPKPPTQPGQPAQPPPGQPEAPPINPEEEKCYTAFLGSQAEPMERRIERGEECLKKFPESRYRETVYARLAEAYRAQGNEEKMFAAGEKALELNADNVAVLSLMAWALPRRITPRDLDAEQKLQKAEKYSKHAIELMANMQKPENLPEEDFTKAKNEALSMCHSGLGLIYVRRERYTDSVAELEQATRLVPNPEPAEFYLLGLAYRGARRFADAVTAFTRCSEAAGLPQELQDLCKQELERSKKIAAAQPAAPKP